MIDWCIEFCCRGAGMLRARFIASEYMYMYILYDFCLNQWIILWNEYGATVRECANASERVSRMQDEARRTFKWQWQWQCQRCWRYKRVNIYTHTHRTHTHTHSFQATSRSLSPSPSHSHSHSLRVVAWESLCCRDRIASLFRSFVGCAWVANPLPLPLSLYAWATCPRVARRDVAACLPAWLLPGWVMV